MRRAEGAELLLLAVWGASFLLHAGGGGATGLVRPAGEAAAPAR